MLSSAAETMRQDHDALLHLDPQIRLFVLVPITVAMFFVGVIRHNVSKVFQGVGKKIDYDGLREAQAVVRATRRVFLQRHHRRVQPREQEEQHAATNALGSVDAERNADEKFEHDRAEHAHHGVGEFLLHWIRGWESSVPVDAAVSIDVATRDRFEEFRRDVRVVLVVVVVVVVVVVKQ